MLHVLFVCTGNICRSPIAQGLLEHYLQTAGLSEQITVTSAATHGYQTGAPPDSLAQTVASRSDIAIGHLRARQIGQADFFAADYIAAMDIHNLRVLHALAPASQSHKIRLLLEFAGEAGGEIADPYGCDLAAYETAYRHIDRGVRGLLRVLRGRLAAVSVDGK